MRHFGIEEANRLIPLLQETFDAIRPLTQKLQFLLSELWRRSHDGGDVLAPLARERDALLAELKRRLEPLEELGVEVKAVDGLVDFRAWREGRTVYLCWKVGEPEVRHWHELEAGFAGRERITHPGDFTPSYPC
ncbi:MAG: DUF2203 domain-containing protein [Myxococcaceae bacterium]